MSDEPNTWGVLAAIYPQLDAITASYVLRTLRTLAGTETALPPGTITDGDAPVLRAHSGSSAQRIRPPIHPIRALAPIPG